MQRDIGFIASSNDKWTGEMERRLARLFGASFAYLLTYPKGLLQSKRYSPIKFLAYSAVLIAK